MQGKGKWIIAKIRNNLVLLAAGTLFGLLALLLVYCIPTEPIQEHIYYSLPLLEREFTDAKLVEGYPETLPGSFTDCLMLEHAVYRSDGHTLLEQVLHMYRGESAEGDGWAPGYSLIDYLAGQAQPREVEYARYWHGYLVALRPLLFLTSFNSIRIMSSAFQLILVGMVVMACCRKKEEQLGMAFLVSVPFLYYVSLFASLSLSICFYVMALALLVQLAWDEQLRTRGRYCEFFLITGMAACYFDFLTYPLVTLGFPLCVCLYLDRDGIRKRWQRLAGYSVQWGVGYLGLWALKWALSDILTDSSTIKDGLATIFERTDSVAEHTRITGFFSVLGQNAGAYLNGGFYLLELGIVIWIIRLIVKNRKKITGNAIRQGLVFLPIAFYPFIWFFLVQNHSEQHWVFTCKNFALTVFAGLCAIGKICGGAGPCSGERQGVEQESVKRQSIKR